MSPDTAPLAPAVLAPARRRALAAVSSAAGATGAKALYLLGLDRAAGGDLPAAAALWREDIARHAASGWDRLAQYQLAGVLARQGQGAQAFLGYQGLLNPPAVAGLPELARKDCLELVAALPAADLRALLADGARPEFLSPLRLRLMALDLAAGQVDAVGREMDAYLKDYPLGPGLDEVEALSRKLDAAVVVDPRAIGLLVPLQGVMAAFGTQIEQGARLAVDAANAGRPAADAIRLVVADEGSDTATAVRSATALIEQDHVIGMLGPLSSDSARAILPLLAAHRTVLLSPSASRPGLAGASPWFFRNTLTPERQASAMADYAVVERRLTRVACLSSDDPYGSVMARAFSQRLGALGGVVAASVTFAPGTRDFRQAMLALGGVDPGVGKSADQDEMRDQQAKVESACNAFGPVLAQRVEELQQRDREDGLTGTPAVRLLIPDFSADTAAATFNAGRAFADRFARTLSQLDGVEVIGPQEAGRYFGASGLTPAASTLSPSASVGTTAAASGPTAAALGATVTALGATATAQALGPLAPAQAAQAAQAAGADFILCGGSTALPPDPVRWPNRALFSLTARLLDSLTATECARAAFTWTQYVEPPSNTLGLQAVYLPASAGDVVAVAPDMLFFNLDLPLLGSDQWDQPELRNHLDELGGAVFTTAYWPDTVDPAVRGFDAAYRAAFAAKPDVLAAQAYDSANLLIRALRSGVSDRPALRSYLAGVDGYDGASGHFGFHGLQDAQKSPAFVGVTRSALILLKEP